MQYKIQTTLLMSFISMQLTACLPQIESETVQVETAGSGAVDPGFTTTPEDGTNSTAPSDNSAGTGGVLAGGSSQPTTGTQTTPNDSDLEFMLINGGSDFTSSSKLLLTLLKDDSLQMKITANKNCQGGSWRAFENQVEYDLSESEQNRLVELSVRFIDLDGVRSSCYSAAILHDNVGPDILFKKYPETSLRENTPVEIIYNVEDSGSGVDTVICSLNGYTQPCGSGNTAVHIPGAAPAVYTFEVAATDKAGFTSKKSVSWTVTAWGRRVTHDVSVAEYRKWDILIVDDNSGSMTYEQKSMADRTRNFLSILRGLDWQIAVTTTDPRAPQYDKRGSLVSYVGGDGALIELSQLPGQFILNSSMMSEANAQSILSDTLQRPEVGSGSEQGIRAVYRVIERSLAEQGQPLPHAQLIRNDANLAVVLISDEDESANTNKNDPQKLLDLIKTSYSGQKNFIFNSIVTMPGDKSCLEGEGATYGQRYKAITELTGGVMGSVCESDYAAQMVGIAENIRSQAKSFTLNCVPLAEQGVKVYRDGVVVSEPFTLSGVKLTFDQAIQPGQFQLVYYCLNE